MPPVRPAPHPAPKFTRRRLTFPRNAGEPWYPVFNSVRRRGRGATRRYDTSNAVSAAANTSQSPPAAGAARSRATKLSRSYNDPASRTTTPRFGKISAYQFFDHDQFFDTGHRRRARARPARARADASRRAGACDASFATATALSAPRHTAYLVRRRFGFASNKSYEGCRPFFLVAQRKPISGRDHPRPRVSARAVPSASASRACAILHSAICLEPRLVYDTSDPKSGRVWAPACLLNTSHKFARLPLRARPAQASSAAAASVLKCFSA